MLNDPNKLNDDFLKVPGNSQPALSCLTYFEFHRHGDASFTLKPVTENTVLKALQALKSQAVGVDDISLDMLNLTASKTLPAITHIINSSFKTNTFPELWKRALVQPIAKKENPATSKDLRPISILPCLSKVIERIVHGQLTQYLEQNGLLSDLQSGFRKGRGTVSALTDVVDNILTAQDSGMSTAIVFLDYTRAFDTINIPLLLSKMSFYGLSKEAVSWFSSYLSNRTQTVALRKEDGAVDYKTLIGQEVYVAGHGATNVSSTVDTTYPLNKPLQVYKGMINVCLKEERQLVNYPLCVSSACGSLAMICGGDSGGAMIHTSGIVGINSASLTNCEQRHYLKRIHKHSLARVSSAIIAPISPALDWISRTVTLKPLI
ncbi:unnamed protein product [Colias eurytheme]|nr:unnamed protein product [Colias eurytheme]